MLVIIKATSKRSDFKSSNGALHITEICSYNKLTFNMVKTEVFVDMLNGFVGLIIFASYSRDYPNRFQQTWDSIYNFNDNLNTSNYFFFIALFFTNYCLIKLIWLDLSQLPNH